MGRLYQEQIECTSTAPTKIYVCKNCAAPLTSKSFLVSKDFRSKTGSAYLFSNCINAHTGIPEDRELLSGLHTVADLYCNICGVNVGWKYLEAFNESQKYKEHKVILEKALIGKRYIARGSYTHTEVDTIKSNIAISSISSSTSRE